LVSYELEGKISEQIETDELGNHRCKLCGKEFAQRGHMKNHIETHMEGLSYPCQLCQKTFKTRNLLGNHKSRIHKKHVI